MKKLLLGSVLGALVLFVWGAIFWMNPAVYSPLPRIPDEPSASRLLLEIFPASGTYLVPDPRLPGETLNQRSLAGPTATVHLLREGRPAMNASTFLLGFLHEFVTVFLLSILLRWALPATSGYLSRAGFVAMIGGIMVFFSTFGPIIWWRHPSAFHLINATYELPGWLLVAMIVAHFVRPDIRHSPSSVPQSVAAAAARR